MALELLESIRNAENQANIKKQDALNEAKQIVKKAHENGEKLILETEKFAEIKANEILSKAEKDAVEISKLQKTDFSAQSNNLKNSASAEIPNAVNFIIRELAKL